jgi:hypothetical protein
MPNADAVTWSVLDSDFVDRVSPQVAHSGAGGQGGRPTAAEIHGGRQRTPTFDKKG